jgi:hypothetical protein
MEVLPFVVTFTVLFTVMFFILGGVVGWIAKEFLNEKFFKLPHNIHPEMLDENGNILPDQTIAVNFYPESYYDYNEDEDED